MPRRPLLFEVYISNIRPKVYWPDGLWFDWREITLQEFTVVCTTCQSRIRVRNPNLIGQIVPCPKCSSMVLIENQQRVIVSPSGDAANSQTETKEALGPLPKLSDQASNHGDSNKERFRADRMNSLVDSGSGAISPPPEIPSASLSSQQAAATRHAASPVQQSPIADSGLADLSHGDWLSKKAKARRQILLVFFLSLTSCFVAILLFVLFLRSWNEKPKLDLGEKTTAWQESETSKGSDALTGDVKSEEVGTPAEIPTQAEAPADSKFDPSSDFANDAPSNGNSDDTMETESIPDTNPKESTSEDVTMAADSPAKESLADVSPKPMDAMGDASISNSDATPGTTATEPIDKAPPLPDSLRKLATVFDPSLEIRLGELPGTRMQAGLSTPDIAALPVLSSAKLHPPAAAPVDIAKRLGEELAGIEIQERPISEFLEVWSQLSGVGIDMQWNQLAAVNVGPNTRISVRSGRTSYQNLLDTVLTPLGLESIPQEQSLVRLAPMTSKVGELLPTNWPIDDLVTEKSTLEVLERILHDLLPSLHDVVKLEKEGLAWDDRATVFQKFSVLEVLEHLRVVRGIPLKSAYQRSLFERAWPTPTDQSAMINPLLQPVVKNAPVSQVLCQATREVQAALSIDWVGTWEHGLSPWTEDTFLPRGRSLRLLADAVAFKYGLEVGWLSSNHLVLTTLPRLNQMEMMVHWKSSQQPDLESLKRRLSRFSTLSAQDLPSIRFAIDPESDMLIAIIRPLRSDEVGQLP